MSDFDLESWNTYTEKDGLISNLIYSSIMDADGRLWFGGKRPNGVACYDGSSWTKYTEKDNDLGPGHIWDMALDQEGRLWLGTAGGGVIRYDGRIWRRFTMAEGLAGNHVYAVEVDADGKVWLGCAPEPDVVVQQGGVSLFDGDRFQSLTSDYTQGVHVGGGNSSLCDNRVYAIVFDLKGTAWFGTKGGGICSYTGQEWATYNSSAGLPCNEVGDGAAGLDSEGHVWFGLRGGGACRFSGRQDWMLYSMEDGLAGNFVYAVLEGPDGNLWFGCAPDPDKVVAEGGISVFDGVAFHNYTSDKTGGESVGGGNSPLADNRVYTILFDRDSNGWFGTKGGGVSRLRNEAIVR
jgi:ligand-binding sensor domain-containing protein